MTEIVMFEDWVERCKRLGFQAVKLDAPKVLDFYEPTLARQIHMELWYYIADSNGAVWSTEWQTEDLAWEHASIETRDLELLEVGGELAKLIYSSGDKNETHARADMLIMRALKAMRDEETTDLIDAILTRYERVTRRPATAADALAGE